MDANNNPLALDSWINMSGPNSYSEALRAVESVVDPEKDSFYAEYPTLTNFIINALYDRIASQSQANYAQYTRIEQYLLDELEPYVSGQKQPAELVRFLGAIGKLESLEIARRTHRRWDAHEQVDHPVRSNLDNAKYLETKKIKSSPLYRIKNLNVVDASQQFFVQIDRKRTVRQHFGGSVLTVVRNSLVLHNKGDVMPSEIREFIQSERQDALRVREAGETHYDYDKHIPELQNHLEPHIMNHSINEKPAWAVPILTTYYSVKRDAIKADVLKDFDVEADINNLSD